MTNTPIISPTLKPARPIWFWLVPITAAASMLLILASDLLELRSRQPDCANTMVALPFHGPYLAILALFPWTRLRKAGLALAIGTGAVTGGLIIVGSISGSLAGGVGKVPGGWIVGTGAMALVQAAMVVSAVKLYHHMERKPKDRRTLALGLFASIIWFLFNAVSCDLRNHELHEPHLNEVSAGYSLRTINAAEKTYAETYKAGFSRTLAMLRPPTGGAEPTASASGLIDEVLAAGRKSGYTFTYTPRATAESGPIRSYTVTAQPIKYGESGCRSFFSDDSGVIHETRENRPATLNDSLIPQ